MKRHNDTLFLRNFEENIDFLSLINLNDDYLHLNGNRSIHKNYLDLELKTIDQDLSTNGKK